MVASASVLRTRVGIAPSAPSIGIFQGGSAVPYLNKGLHRGAILLAVLALLAAAVARRSRWPARHGARGDLVAGHILPSW